MRLLERVTERLGPGHQPVASELLLADLAALVSEVASTRARTAPVKAASTLKQLGRWLLARELVLFDPARDLVVPKLVKRLGWVPSVAEVARLIAAAAPESVLARVDLDEPPTNARRRRLRRV